MRDWRSTARSQRDRLARTRLYRETISRLTPSVLMLAPEVRADKRFKNVAVSAEIVVYFHDNLDRSYQIEQWNYLWCSEYGSEDYSARTPDFQAKVQELNRLREDRARNGAAIAELTKQLAKGRDEVEVKGAKLSEDGKTVSLEIPDIKPVMQMKIRGRLKSADGKRVVVDVYNTINAIP